MIRRSVAASGTMSAVENIDISALDALRREGQIELVDVRTDQEVSRGIIAGARHIPLHVLPARYEEIPRDRPVVFYCQSGARSLQAGSFLAAKGWRRVYNLSGGLLAWLRSGLPVTQPEQS
ncbi:MAG TPA: rhodanese-like domain-containing protein [Burkholderiales bacterium]|jgi:rhodanese-related sulfurtransferase|nr:rhodanese-like domain-containing protein [Burkholderiales bacterium]